MKIAFLSFWSGVVYRGVETYVHELADRLVGLGHEVTVFQNGPAVYGGKYKTISAGLEFKMFSGGNLAVFLNQFIGANINRKFTLKILSILDRDTDILVATNNRFQAFLSRLWCLGKRTKLVIPGQGGPGIDERIAVWCFPDAFIPLSDFQKKWVKNANPFVKLSGVIHNGVNLKEFSKDHKKLDFGLKGKIVLCAAALWPAMKRQHLLIKAIAKLDNVSLVLAGEGESRNELVKLCEKYIPGRFLIKSYKYSEMPSVYASADVFSFPTWKHESFGIAMVEAMASNLPVVASDDPIRREIVGDAGIFVDPNDTDAYAKAIQKALNTDWKDKPRKQAEKFDWDKIAVEYENLFKSLI